MFNFSIESEELRSESKSDTAIGQNTRKTNDWREFRTFDSITAARNFLIERKFAYRDKKVDKNGTAKTKYRCKAAKRRAKVPCACEYRIVEPSDERNKFILEHNGVVVHNHDKLSDDDKAASFPFEMIDLIVECSKKRMTAKRIIEHLTDLQDKFSIFKNEKIPSLQQVYEIIRKHKTKESPPIVSIGELVVWCESHSEIPMDEDTPFVMNFETCSESEEMFFRFAVSTKRMLSNCIGLAQICVDATYKLVWNGFPFLVVGTVDRAKKFHPLCFACTSNERKEDFVFMFESMKSSISNIFNDVFDPTVLISDAALSIRNAFEQVFDAKVMIMCYAHVLRNITKRPLKDKRNKKQILADIRQMNLATSVESFQLLSKLFLVKWKDVEPDFVMYFEEQWLGSHCNWYEAAAVYSPSTNNNLEGTLKK